MMNWTSAEDVQRQLERLWLRGTVLRGLIGDGGDFPTRLSLKAPSISELEAHFAQADEWVSMIRQLPGLRLEWRTVKRSILGRQQLPAQLWAPTPQSVIDLLAMRDEADTFLALYEVTRSFLPEALPWLLAHPLRALAAEAVWQRALIVARWKRDHPDAAPVYLRQLNLPGVDTKFIEANTTLLRNLFNLICSPAPDDSDGVDFCARYGFLREAPRVRFRLLDPMIVFAGLPDCPDIELDAESFAGLRLNVTCVIVLENKTTYLTFPHALGSIAIFGAGYGARALEKAKWLNGMRVLYWGDIDTHGFAILSQLREFLPHAESILMDEQTLLTFRECWTSETAQYHAKLTRLTEDEQAVFEALKDQRFGPGIRLEQEKIPLSRATDALSQLNKSSFR